MKNSLKTSLKIIQIIAFTLVLLVFFTISYKMLVLNYKFEQFISNSIIENDTVKYIINAMYKLDVLSVVIFSISTIFISFLYHDNMIKKLYKLSRIDYILLSLFLIGNIILFVNGIIYTITTFQMKELIRDLVGVINPTALDSINFFNNYLMLLGITNNLLCLAAIFYVITIFIYNNIFKSTSNQII